MRCSRLAAVLLAGLLTAVLAACGGSGDNDGGLPTLSDSSSSAPTQPARSTPSTSHKPTAAPTVAVTKYQDLTLELVRPAKLDRKASVAFERLQRFQALFASMIAGAPTSAEFSQLANAVTVKRFNDLLKPQRQNPTMAMRAVLSNTTGPWRVDEYYLVNGKC
ncbi:hypothetical protein [Streptomyces sp. SID13031]|uniref:hypothetical protein n=1 Tax=Streptomyces sp. SID13031 TaxID=2706046 RepID=UPI0013C8BC57|nr:hypothetical protein [Streptomyces sp. SID13031]NEA31528.1 hypothetical protein [Streptomyces sp. SID13031]